MNAPPTRRKRSIYFRDGLRCWLSESWDELTYRRDQPPRLSYRLRSIRCAAGFHWPIKYSGGYSYGYEPPEPTWECDFCGVERMPYRARLWDSEAYALVMVAWSWIKNPRQMWADHKGWKAYDRRVRDAERANPS